MGQILVKRKREGGDRGLKQNIKNIFFGEPNILSEYCRNILFCKKKKHFEGCSFNSNFLIPETDTILFH